MILTRSVNSEQVDSRGQKPEGSEKWILEERRHVGCNEESARDHTQVWGPRSSIPGRGVRPLIIIIDVSSSL